MKEYCPPECLRQNCFATIVGSLCENIHNAMKIMKHRRLKVPHPSRDSIIVMIEQLRSVLFPGYFGTSELDRDNVHFYVGATVDSIQRTAKEQIRRGLCFTCDDDSMDCMECEENAAALAREFMERLPHIQKMLNGDVQAAYEGDPAATSPDETIFCYPGILAIINYRIAHELYRLKVPLIPRIITEHAHSITGIDIHPGATIGERFFIDHGTGVVIGETTEIGANVRIYQGVTLGAKSFPLDSEGKPIKGIKRHPVVEDEVIIYSGATVLGRVTIGRASVIGGNVWLTHGCAPGSTITQSALRKEHFDKGSGI